ncbi:hypothetical protein DSO57_1019417 [Entomophthora muscae]|uniref:Uncharacterized protein n=1 Tax=Entomophthora muscae TaxID=34485 RepID=A0ACC2RIS4_9FUNG|nr:hypothetical protein DSO57_1019417 [Entomophthora muscae]
MKGLQMLEWILRAVLCVGFVSNVVCLWVILRQDIRKIDMGLAFVMASSDLLLVVYKLVEAVCMHSAGPKAVLANAEFGQWHGVMTTFLLQMSLYSVGFMAALRFWAIYLRRRVNAPVWWTVFVVPQLILIVFLVAVAIQGRYQSLQVMFLFFPEIKSSSWVVVACRYQLLFYHTFPVIAVNISYPCIARLYQVNLRHLQSTNSLGKQTCLIYAKIVSLVLIYDLAMVPVVYVFLAETLTNELQSPLIESVSLVTLISMTCINPLVLLTLHHETLREFKHLLSHVRARLSSYNRTSF